MSDYIEEGFEDWLRDLPISFINHMYSIWRMNLEDEEESVLASINGSDLTYIGPLDTFDVKKVIRFVRNPNPITEEDIQRVNSKLLDNGIEESA